MFQAITTHSTFANPQQALEDLVTQCEQSIECATAALFYVSCELDYVAFVNELSHRFPLLPFIGCPSMGEVSSELGYQTASSMLMLFYSDQIKIKTGVVKGLAAKGELEQKKLIEQRMNKFNEETSHWNEYNYVFVNDDLNTCCEKILNIIMSEKKGISQKQNSNEIEKKVKELIK